MPLYINVDYTLLPDTYEKLRYVYYFNSIQLFKQQAEIKTILTNVLGATNLEDKVIFDPTSNAVIFTASADIVKTAMRLISELDESGFKEAVEIIKLEYAAASEVSQLLTSMIGEGDKKQTGFASLTGSTQKARYFSEYATIINLDPTNARKLNSLVLIGKQDDVKNIKDFIHKYLDIPQQQGKSFYHVVDLDWLKADQFVQVLQSIIQGQGSGSGQSSGASAVLSNLAFDPQIKVIAEKTSQGLSGGSGSNTAQRGGNRLVIAAPERDWHRIASIIKQVDIPQKQVVIEALVVDLDLQFIRRLGAQIRTRGLCPSIFPKDMQAQAGLLFNNVINADSSNNPIDLTGDLSNILQGVETSQTTGFDESGYTNQTQWDNSHSNNGESAASTMNGPAGFNSSTVFMLTQDRIKNGVWAFFQLLSTHKTAKILTRPVLIATNNKQATLTSSSVKQLAQGVSTGTSPTVQYAPIESPITINFTPIISANNIVNLQMHIELTLWLNATSEESGAKITRTLDTNISMRSGDVVILGGLIKEHVSKSKKSIPLLDRIPILGNLAANRFKDSTRDQLFILLRPTVVEPRKQGGMGSITKSSANFMQHQFEDYENLFSSLRDPVTRWFFNEKNDSGSVKMDDKITDLANKEGLPVNTLPAETDQEKEDVAKNPLQVGWFSDATHNKEKTELKPEMKQLEQKLQTVINPFDQRLVL